MEDLAYRVHADKKVDLGALDPADTHGIDRAQADNQVAALGAELTILQETHYAAAQNSILVVLQGIDTAGKDGTIRHVMASFNPASCRVESFKVPTPEERSHDYLWRIHKATPPLGSIAIFNRSQYEDVLVTRVHKLVPESVLESRYEHINNFEQLLIDTGTIILKFFLHISKNEQRERLLARERDPAKAWKLSPSDWPEHELYHNYVDAYELALSKCSTKQAPWFVVPSDKKWFRNLAVAQTLVNAMQPYKGDWEREIERRGKLQLEAIAAQKAGK